MAFPYAGVTSAIEELTAQRKTKQEEERKSKELAFQNQLQKELKMTPEVMPPAQEEYYRSRGKADIQQAATQDFETKSNMWQKMIDPNTGEFIKGKEVLGHIIEAELLRNYGNIFQQGGTLAEGGGNTPQEVATLGAIREFVNNPIAENRKKIMDVSGYAEGVPERKAEITPTTALSILSDPFKSQQLKKNYPEYYNMVIKIAEKAFGKGVTGKVLPEGGQSIESPLMDTNW